MYIELRYTGTQTESNRLERKQLPRFAHFAGHSYCEAQSLFGGSGSQANTPHRAIPERQAARSRRDTFFSPRRLLRDVLRGRRSRRARARHSTDLAEQGRRPALRRPLPLR
jgi:hypothetical protein